MEGVFCDDYKGTLLDNMLTQAPFTSPMVMGLFTTINSVDHTFVLGSLGGNELAVAGYARQTLAGWSAASLNGSFQAVTQAADVTFNNTSGSATGLITGWFYYDPATNLIVMVGLFANPFVIGAGSTYTTTPFWDIQSEDLTNP
jgi:hypothetical protein